MTGKRALVTGVGPGTGTSIVRRFVEGGYDVAMIARNEERLRQLEAKIGHTQAFPVDVADTARFDQTLDRILADFGPPEVVVHNAVGGVFGNFMQIDPAALLHNFQVNVMSMLHLARRTAPAMIEAGSGAIVASGTTSALRGKSNFSGFAPTKAAQRILAESIARELGPKGIHVAYIVIDAVIDLEWTRALRPDAPDDVFIQPSDIAEEIWHVVHQPKGAWSFNVEVRPFKENW
ncbi:SDR family NAD(P)-dependent oxidoreductase [Bradyrhizobium canariense]|uniref:Short-chain dehydrogenase n=1 Tax=Bradyrhizobium canariense TaxID=255045 RepID=A0A1H1YPD9_9BRAD|nr:SDR family NAD(P)-dependent oxidoreductase [Bradyrhizobium canariense]SDT23333.1 Short-chain dehydrogenase [Bradyrhizobium canariense]